jgi:hypothetical protein
MTPFKMRVFNAIMQKKINFAKPGAKPKGWWFVRLSLVAVGFAMLALNGSLRGYVARLIQGREKLQ